MEERGRKSCGEGWAEFSRTRQQTFEARSLRRDATPAERILWTKLNQAQLGGFKFRRQHPIGPYVLDFYCPEIRLCIELDGDQHGYDREIVRDVRPTEYLNRNGVEVMRFWNHEVRENLIGVAETILHRAIELRSLDRVEGGIPSPWKGEG
ncbi:MAG: endonuclease domain-containing protein [Parvularculaceae bacterium]